ncbi:MAG TPA: dihydrodipicolinate synthase family protein [Chloroflexota bacterium]|nr:dihydrodipicolinate synthase family protein [Chloroflexota bacterium]
MLKPTDLRGMYAIIATPAKDGAERLDATNTVDLDETERLANKLIADGASGFIALGTTGECATVIREDYEAFVDCLLATVNRRVPTFVGTTALGAHEVFRRMRFIRERGADGTLLGMPMWQPCTVDMAVEYYASMSEAFPELAIMVYANSRAFRFDYTPEFWGRVVDKAPTVMSAKFSRPDTLLACLEASKGRVHFLPNEGAALRFAQLSPDTTTACWATAASMGPQPAIAMMDAILAKDLERAKIIDADLKWASQTVEPIIRNPELFASYNIQLEKIRIDAAGYSKAGPIRPPYNVVPADIAEASRENGRRWAELAKKYALAKAGA